MTVKFGDARQALAHLLDMSERFPERQRIRSAPDYAAIRNNEELKAFHGIVEAAPGVDIRRLRRPEGPADIHFIELTDPAALARFLGREPAVTEAAAAMAALRHGLTALPDWIAAIVDEIGAAWVTRREAFPGLVPGDVSTARSFVAILLAFERGDHLHGLDMRSFSQRACGDSKAVERGEARIARALARHFDVPSARPSEILASLGVEKFPHPILLRANLSLCGAPSLVARPYVGLPPDWASQIRFHDRPDYVLIIENLASFNRHVREIDDGGAALYSGGFPSRAVTTAIETIDRQLAPEIPFFHWGDTDRHGFLILDYIARRLKRPLVAHMMELTGGAQEQEARDPVSPLDLSSKAG